jgi:hypothetical protein
MGAASLHSDNMVLENLSESGFSVRSNPRFEEHHQSGLAEAPAAPYEPLRPLATSKDRSSSPLSPVDESSRHDDDGASMSTADALHAATLLAQQFDASSPSVVDSRVNSSGAPYRPSVGDAGQVKWLAEEDLVDLEPVPEGEEEDDDDDDFQVDFAYVPRFSTFHVDVGC